MSTKIFIHDIDTSELLQACDAYEAQRLLQNMAPEGFFVEILPGEYGQPAGLRALVNGRTVYANSINWEAFGVKVYVVTTQPEVVRVDTEQKELMARMRRHQDRLLSARDIKNDPELAGNWYENREEFYRWGKR